MNEGIRVTEVRSCPFCGSEGVLLYQGLRDRLFAAPGAWALLQCSQCQLVWLNPRPVPADIGKLYERYFTHEATIQRLAGVRKVVWEGILAARLGYPELGRSGLQRGLGRALSWLGPIRQKAELSVMTLSGHRRGTLLEVGCGGGQFLARMRDLGWKVQGVEFDGQAVKVAREHLGLSIREGTLGEVGFAADTFNVVAMHHVIEHLCDPVGTLQECRRVLKPGGRLVVATPNVASLGHRLFRDAWRGLEVPRHLHLFSPRALLACAARAGFPESELRTTARKAGWMWTASCLTSRDAALPDGSSAKPGLWLRLQGLAFEVVEHALCRKSHVGEELVLIARK
jgi:2-polyprenyl-3-methyl-5-hydroxy-6-metoxy-1,4-benzoquinol methylase